MMKKMTSQTQHSATFAAPVYGDVPCPVEQLTELSSGALSDAEITVGELSDADLEVVSGGARSRGSMQSRRGRP